MQDESTARFPTLAVRLAALWLAVGALFKLIAGSPNDLPPMVRDFTLPGLEFGSPGVILKLAISIELVFVFTALLRPRWGWPWLCAQFVLFLGLLTAMVLEVQRVAVEPISFGQAMFDPDASCGCFGSTVKLAPGYMMIADAFFLLLMLASRPWRGRLGSWGPEWLPTGFACLALVLPWVRATREKPVAPADGGTPAVSEEPPVGEDPPANATAPAGDEPAQPARPAQPDWWVGLTVDQLEYVEIPVADWDGGFLYDLTFRPYPDEPEERVAPFWSVMGLDDELALLPIDATFVLYRDSCDHCAEHIQELATSDAGERALVFLRVPEPGVETDVVHLDQLYPEGTPHATRLDLPAGAPYVFTTPGDFQVDGGMVSAPREGIGR